MLMDIEFEILTWLPAKSLMRFKCVSKGWNTWICHPYFVKYHSACSRVRPSATRLLFQFYFRRGLKKEEGDSPGCYSRRIKKRRLEESHNSKRGLEPFNLQVVPQLQHSFIVCSNHCNGLVCLYSSKDCRAYLYNVTTGEKKALPVELPDEMHPAMFLGFDSVTGKYKLLHIIEEKNLPVKAWILTLDNQGSRRKLCLPRGPRWYSDESIFFNGVVYFDPVFYFNFTEEKLGRLSPPKHTTHHWCLYHPDYMLTALWGKLVMHNSRYTFNPHRLLYDEVNKVFTTLDSHPISEERALLTKADRALLHKADGCHIFATSSFFGAPAFSVIDGVSLFQVSCFVENIIPLSALI